MNTLITHRFFKKTATTAIFFILLLSLLNVMALTTVVQAERGDTKLIHDTDLVDDIPGQTITEGQSFNQICLNDYANPPHGQALLWSASGYSDLTVDINLISSVATITYSNGWTGSETITFNASYSDGLHPIPFGPDEIIELDAIPGMMDYKGAKIQILDLPGLITGAADGKGRGREVLSAVRNVDLILFMVDAQHDDHLDVMAKELFSAGLRLNQKLPDVVVKKTGQGGINVTATAKLTHLTEEVIKSISSEYVINADIIVREDVTEDQLIDVYIQNRRYIPALVIINKIDLIEEKQLQKKINSVKSKGWKTVSISAKNYKGMNRLKEMIFKELNFIRIYMKPVGKPIDFDEPLILKQGSTVEDVCRKLHREFKDKFRFANVSGPSAKHDVQKVGLNHVLHDSDVLTIVVTR